MRAILCKEMGPADRLVIEEAPSPTVSGDQVKLKVKAVGLNFPDTLIIEGKYQVKPDLPFSPGSELSGEVIETGPDVKHLQIGQRVMGQTGYGAFAEEIAVPETQLVPVPDAMTDNQAAAFSMVYGTSYHALKQRADMQPGETLLVLGASGGVGLAAVELGKAMGATVVAAASSDDKLEVAQAAGADDLINYTTDDFKGLLKSRFPGGFDVVYDPVGDKFADPAIRNMAWKGRYLVVGFAAGEIPRLPFNLLLLKGCSAVGVFWGAFTKKEPQTHMQNIRELMALFSKGVIQPHISEVYGFDDYEKALSALTSRRAKGKVVLKVSD